MRNPFELPLLIGEMAVVELGGIRVGSSWLSLSEPGGTSAAQGTRGRVGSSMASGPLNWARSEQQPLRPDAK